MAHTPREVSAMAVYQDATGQWWAAIESGYTRSGGRRRVRRRCSGKRSATEMERRLLRERDAGTLVDHRAPTMKAWGEEWLDRQRTRVRPKTWTGYQTTIRAYVIPTIGKTKLAQLTPGHIRQVVQAVRAAGRTSTVARDHQVRLTKCLRDALADGHQVPATVLAVEKPRRSLTDRTAIPHHQVTALMAVIGGRADRSRWLAALLQGMRQGECLGLTWSCVDLDAGVLEVSWQLQALRYRHGCDATGPAVCGRRFGGDCPHRALQIPDDYEIRRLRGAVSLVRPKTSSGSRVIPLVPWMVTALTEWRVIAPTSPHDLVWPDDRGEPREPRDDVADWYALQALAGVEHPAGRRWSMHEARHTAATLLLEAGIDPHTVTAILGHSSITTSRGYQHVSQALARQAMETVAARLGLPSGDSSQ